MPKLNLKKPCLDLKRPYLNLNLVSVATRIHSVILNLSNSASSQKSLSLTLMKKRLLHLKKLLSRIKLLGREEN